MQGLMLAAGMGKRLAEYTNNNTKCMLKIGEVTLLERAINALKNAGINKLIIVVGYKGENVKKFVKENIKDFEVIFIDNLNYESSNNIYSLYLAKEYLETDNTILLESDLIYEEKLIKELMNNKNDNVAVVAKYEEWMDGTVVTIDEEEIIKEFITKNEIKQENINEYYKTVNIYKLSREFCKREYIPFLEAYMKAYGVNEYYELVLKAITNINKTKIFAMPIKKIKWYEIDNSYDLNVAKNLFEIGGNQCHRVKE